MIESIDDAFAFSKAVLHMDEAFFSGLSRWLTQAALGGLAETQILSGACERPLRSGWDPARPRRRLHRDTLHPVHEGRVFVGPSMKPLCMNMAVPAWRGPPLQVRGRPTST
jgi:hypothetical protein